MYKCRDRFHFRRVGISALSDNNPSRRCLISLLPTYTSYNVAHSVLLIDALRNNRVGHVLANKLRFRYVAKSAIKRRIIICS